MWDRERLKPPYVMLDQEITDPVAAIEMAPEVNGAHMIVRYRGHPVSRIWLPRYEYSGSIPISVVEDRIHKQAGQAIDQMKVRLALENRTRPARTPDLTVVVCTRNRADLLRRCLGSLIAMRDARLDHGPAVDLLVVDNAPPDDSTRNAVAEFPGVRYAVEPVPGLDFGRNRAIASTNRAWLAYVDDDAVVDRYWLDRLAEEIERCPDAGCFTGPILPMMLETEAQLRFEWAGGFGKGFFWKRYASRKWGDAIYPAGSGMFGTGACMVYSTAVLRELGLFDEALDTGPPLPGGGDIDMFYRVVRSGRPLVYAGGILVHHEHRRDIPGLRKQYGSWGAGLMALWTKNWAQDPSMRPQHKRLLRWYAGHLVRQMLRSLRGRGGYFPSFVWAEMIGAVKGYFGEYGRSQKRIAERKAKVLQ
ncbi:glycosyltransferase [Tabrizicola sp. J26]|uniref:glycosyltransferase family 2 protein n=1 Tax=Alitabrizicola rongguiensis TaxID=2909234 RepID=UPI001F2AC1E0|nr:glycosyltransferase [Tabrizicola rongguiensis]MCF1707511.1 glycosyltransferase [Tabrizicola rongguiensis]